MNARLQAAFEDELMKIAFVGGFLDELEKIADAETLGESTLSAVDTARPYAYRALMGSIPGAMLGTALKGQHNWHIPKWGAGIGAAVGLGDKLLEDVAKERKYRKLMSSYHEGLATPATGLAAVKTSAAQEDGRRSHIGLVNPPTEDSKGMAYQQLKSGQAVSRFKHQAAKRALRK